VSEQRKNLERRFVEATGLTPKSNPDAWRDALADLEDADACVRGGVRRRDHYTRLHAYVEPRP
jgi:hypothetical protein